MSTASVAQHTATELVFRTLDESGELAYFLSESKSKQGKRNVTALDTTNGDVFCFCQAAQHNRECWHTQLVGAAWLAHVAAEQVAKAATLSEVVAIGRAAKARIAAWGALTVLVSPLDVAVYEAARRAYARLGRPQQDAPAPVALPAYVARQGRREAAQRAYVGQVMATALRQSTAATERAALTAIVAAWEGLSYSDRHLDRHVDGGRGEREYHAARAVLAARAPGQIQVGTDPTAEGRDVLIAQVATRHLLPISLPIASDFPHDPTDGAALVA